MKNGRKSEIAIGISVILALCFLFYGIDYLKGMNVFKPANYYTPRTAQLVVMSGRNTPSAL